MVARSSAARARRTSPPGSRSTPSRRRPCRPRSCARSTCGCRSPHSSGRGRWACPNRPGSPARRRRTWGRWALRT
eukprot:5705231-Prymnesium_polylepis.1